MDLSFTFKSHNNLNLLSMAISLKITLLKLKYAKPAIDSKMKTKNCCHGLHSPTYTKLGHFMLLLYRWQLQNVQRFKCRWIVLLIKPFVWWSCFCCHYHGLPKFPNNSKLPLTFGKFVLQTLRTIKVPKITQCYSAC